ncbi:hypothetical protein C4D60_Mb11t06080 [Musa balbisiana]|uniref:SGNH hydrolase-type esterase domain-containing protein n=1 Tax=Musa balbisiana TaxID=52838 RepID=A0A4S8J239_MUSBA|nr:hypothetical protein C4D60_Mb11t06080 [Musa balbisiana]
METVRPQFVLFGDSITQQSFGPGGWGAALANTYSRKASSPSLPHQLADVIVRGYGGYNTRWALFLLNHLFSLECSATILVVLITPPPVDEQGRKEYARSVYGEKAVDLPERTNDNTGAYARQCVELAKELHIPCIDLWSKMQETTGWQKKFLSDGLHLTEEGNAVVHKEVVQVLTDGHLRAEGMPYDFPHHSEINSDHPEKAFEPKS